MKYGLLSLATSAAVIALMVWFDFDPRILALAFIWLEVYRYLAIKTLWEVHCRATDDNVPHFVENWLTSMPPAKLTPAELRSSDEPNPYDFLGYVGVFLLLACSFFIPLLYVNADKQFSVSAAVVAKHLSTAAWLAVIYLLGDLVGRTIFMDFSESESKNLGYNVVGAATVTAAIFPAAFVVIWAQSSGKDPNRWVIFGILLGIRHWLDHYWLAQPRRPRPDQNS